MEDDQSTEKLWSIRKTTLELCRDRGYKIDKNELNQTLDEFFEKYGDNPLLDDMNICVKHKADSSERLLVMFTSGSIGRKGLARALKLMQENKAQKGILVYQRITIPAKSLLNNGDFTNIEETFYGYTLQGFQQSELLINITHHELVPKHIPLTPDEKKELLLKHKITEKQLMKILSSDPIVRYYGFQLGQVIKIIRNSETAGYYETHRIVVN